MGCKLGRGYAIARPMPEAVIFRQVHSKLSNLMKCYLSPSEAAKLLMVSPITVRSWAQKGLLPSEMTLGGHRRFLRETVEQFAVQNKNLPEPEKARILVVDDDKFIAGFLLEWLTGLDEPFLVSIASDGFEAGKQVQSFKPDILLLDLSIPDLDGFAICRQIKADPNTKAIRIIAMSEHPSAENIQAILDAGAETCICKPLDTLSLLELLNAT